MPNPLAWLRFWERMASVRTLSAGVAHEINNPLSVVLSNVRQAREELERASPNIAEMREALADAETCALRIRDIVRDLQTGGESLRAREASAAVAMPRGARRAMVAIVDDEPLVAKSVERELARYHDMRVFLSAADFLASVSAGSLFDVIVSDLMMPGMTGMELYERLAPDLARRVVFMTGGGFGPPASEFLERVKNPRLQKPLDRDALLAAVASIAAS